MVTLISIEQHTAVEQEERAERPAISTTDENIVQDGFLILNFRVSINSVTNNTHSSRYSPYEIIHARLNQR